MRVDVLLKYICLVKSRSLAKSLCENGAVKINDERAKPSSNTRAGDRIYLELPRKRLVVEIISIPDKQLSKAISSQYYRVVQLGESTDEDSQW